MTPRRRVRRAPSAYPALRQFARAYLHEDFVHDYGGAVEAARAFSADAVPAERRALADELKHLAAAASDWPAQKLSEFMSRTLGAAWASPSPATLRDMAAAVDVDGP